MDANKLIVLRSIQYTIHRHCGVCAFSDLSADGWGYCDAHDYEHIKHSEERSRLSVHRTGSCPEFVLDEQKLATLGLHAFREFVDEP